MSLRSRHLMPEGLAYALNKISNHALVSSVKVESEEFYKAIVTINRKGFYPKVRAYIADVYILTSSDVNEILDEYSDINCIVIISNWNQYTDMAKEEASDSSVGVFTLTEFMRALNYNGRKFLETGHATEAEQTN